MKKTSGGVLVVLLVTAGLLLAGCRETPTVPPMTEAGQPMEETWTVSPTITPRPVATVLPTVATAMPTVPTPLRFPTLPVTPPQPTPPQPTPYAPAVDGEVVVLPQQGNR